MKILWLLMLPTSGHLRAELARRATACSPGRATPTSSPMLCASPPPPFRRNAAVQLSTAAAPVNVVLSGRAGRAAAEWYRRCADH